MAYKVFLDTNVLLDFTLKRDHYRSAKSIVELAITGAIKAYVTPSILHILGYWLTKAYGNAKAKELLLTLLADVAVIDLPHETAVNALHSKISDIEDALQYYAAVHHKLDYFISWDKQLQKQDIPILRVLTPETFLKEWNG